MKKIILILLILFLIPFNTKSATFGYTSIGLSSGYILSGNGYAFVTKATAPLSVKITKITAYADYYLGGNGNIKGVMWDSSSKNIITNGVGGVSALGGSPAWIDLTYSTQPDVIASTVYYIGYVASNAIKYYFDENASSGNGGNCPSNNYTTPTSLGAFSGYSGKYVSIYATYDTPVTYSRNSTTTINNGRIQINNGRLNIK